MQLIPAIDLMDGKCVRLEKGNFSTRKIYELTPLDVAKQFAGLGVERLHMVDLDAAAGRPSENIKVLKTIAAETDLSIDFGGGLRTTPAVRNVLNAGAAMVNAGSVVVKDQDLFKEWILLFGADKFLPAADVKNMNIQIHGWQEETNKHVFDFIREVFELGISQILSTDISKDGMLKGPAFELYKEILIEFPSLELIASGGVSSYDDLRELSDIGCSGVIIGKAWYEEKITPEEMSYFINNH